MINIDISGLQDARKFYRALPKKILNARRRAVDQAASQIRLDGVAEVVRETTLKGPRAKKKIVVTRRSKPNDVRAQVTFRADSLQLRDFKLNVNTQTGAVSADVGAGPMRVIRGAFWPGRKGSRKRKSRRNPNNQKWNKRQIFERGPAGVTGKKFYQVVIERESERVRRKPIRFVTVAGIINILGRDLDRLIDSSGDVVAAKFTENFDREIAQNS